MIISMIPWRTQQKNLKFDDDDSPDKFLKLGEEVNAELNKESRPISRLRKVFGGKKRVKIPEDEE